MKHLLLASLLFFSLFSSAQDGEGNFLKDPKTGCTVWFKHGFSEDSATWSGGCKDGFATGQGIMLGFTGERQTAKYVGEMLNGKPHGKGVFTFGGDRMLEGNFSNGEPLFLNAECLKHLHKNIVSEKDSTEAYVGDNNLKQLYYHAVVPDGKLNGAIVLMPGTWESTEHMLSSNQALCELAYKNHLAVLALSINQRLTMTDATVTLMNSMFSDAVTRYRIPADKIVMGGFSMGGLFSLRYTELANQDSTKTVIKPAAAFSCDGPCDMENIYNMFLVKRRKFTGNTEADYGIAELERYCGGTPEEARDRYIYFSCYSHAQPDGGNAKYLLNTPVRIYGDVDVNWWMQNRDLDMYSLNALDQSAMILMLNDRGNRNAEFINSYQKGYRIEGNRHPHSWSIVEPNGCMEWVLECLR